MEVSIWTFFWILYIPCIILAFAFKDKKFSLCMIAITGIFMTTPIIIWEHLGKPLDIIGGMFSIILGMLLLWWLISLLKKIREGSIMARKILVLVILLAFGACGFKIYGQQNEIKQWRDRATKYQLENQMLKEQIEARGKDEKKKTSPVNYSYSDSTMDELERYELESKIRSLESDLDNERIQRDIDRNNFEMNRYDPNYSPY